MLNKEIKGLMKEAVEDMLDYEAYEEYSEKEMNDLDQALEGVSYHSHAGSRDCDKVVLTRNKKYECEAIYIQGNKFATEEIVEEWELNDIDDNQYYLSIVIDLDSCDFELIK